MRKRGFVVLGIMLALASVFLIEKVLTPQPTLSNDIPPVESGGFPSPGWVATDGTGEQVLLHWRSVPGALAYTLWRSRALDSDFRVIHLGEDTTYTDQNGLVPGEQYFYMLTATDPEFGESGFSEKICVEFEGGQGDNGR